MRRLVALVRRRLGVRMRSALAAAAVVAVASVLTGIAFVIAVRFLLIRAVDQDLTDRAAQVTAALDDNDRSSLAAVMRPTPRDRTVVQVVDPSGRIVVAS